jgi:DNA gyrase subunit A
MSKVPVSSYETKTNRKKLSNAYNAISPLVGIFFLEEDMDFAAFSSIDKVLVFNTSQIRPKATRDSQGVWVLKSKKGSTLRKILPLNETNLNDPEYYRANVPAIGCYLKEEDKEDTQIGLF